MTPKMSFILTYHNYQWQTLLLKSDINIRCFRAIAQPTRNIMLWNYVKVLLAYIFITYSVFNQSFIFYRHFWENQSFDSGSKHKIPGNPRWLICTALNFTSYGFSLVFYFKITYSRSFWTFGVFDPKWRNMTLLKRYCLENFSMDAPENVKTSA